MESFPKALKGNIRTVYLDFKIKKKKRKEGKNRGKERETDTEALDWEREHNR